MKQTMQLKAEQYMAMAVGMYQNEGLSKTEITAICNGYFESFKRDKKAQKLYSTAKERDPGYEVQGNVISASFGRK
ncbi:hypothetical protein [Sutcliffiella halmapala]|uniref:hypothetical protein n=1 Tax=Sutcliffiella halmapala TaxID=79882 RepID=UPI0009951DC0|nr:hypothetical protein [Sutcliffiella halmapala]